MQYVWTIIVINIQPISTRAQKLLFTEYELETVRANIHTFSECAHTDTQTQFGTVLWLLWDSVCVCVVSCFPPSSLITTERFRSVFYNRFDSADSFYLFQFHATSVLKIGLNKGVCADDDLRGSGNKSYYIINKQVTDDFIVCSDLEVYYCRSSFKNCSNQIW